MLHYRSSVARDPTYYGYPTFSQSKQRVDTQIIKQLSSRHRKQLILVCAASAVVVIALLATTVVFANMFDSNDGSTTPALLNFPGDATLDGTYTDEMNDTNSDAFKQVESDFCSKVGSLVTTGTPLSSQYSACAVNSIRSGSLLIDFTLTMSPSASSNLTEIYAILEAAVRTSNVALGTRIAALKGVETVRVAYDEDSCASSPCDAGASCTDLPVGYVCLQSTAAAPEPEIDYCAGDPCKNGGTCYNTTGEYLCLCLDGYSGKTCSIAPVPEVDYCAGDPCENGGTCGNMPSDYICACVFPYSGKNCTIAPEPEIDYCAGDPCKNGGTCGNMTSDYICACVFPYSGKNCSIAPDPEIDYCAGDPCENGGTCGNMTSDYICACVYPYSGKNCSIVPDPQPNYCAGGPCENGGICYNTTGEYICDCVFPYSGQNCSIVPNPEPDYCAGNPCENGGICYNTTGEYICDCVFPYSGKNCSIAPEPTPDYCAGDPCENDGVCHNSTAGYLCVCVSPFTGTNCSMAVCDRGQSFNGTVCEECPVGSYNTIEGSTSCTPCPNGTTTSNTGSICLQECDVCLAGYEPAGLTCAPCPPGKYKGGPGSLACVECPYGLYSDIAGLPKCIECPPRTYAPSNGMTECLMCNGTVERMGGSCDQCGSAPCENGGVCTNLDTHYSCSCLARNFDGLNCENDCRERTTYWCQPSGWPPMQPNVYLPFEDPSDYTLYVRDTSEQPTKVIEAVQQHAVLVQGLVGAAVATNAGLFQMIALGKLDTCMFKPETCTQGFTFTGWFIYGPCADSSLITGRTDDGQINSFMIDCEAEKTRITVGSSIGYFLGQATSPSDGNWHHIAVTMTEMSEMGIMTSYLDGQKWFEFAALDTMHTPVQDVSEGEVVLSKYVVEPDVDTKYHTQAVDEIAIFDQVLTPEQIHDIYAMSSDLLSPAS